MSRKRLILCLKSSLVCVFLLLFHPANAQKDSLSSNSEFKIFDSLFTIKLPGQSYEGLTEVRNPFDIDNPNKIPALIVKNGEQQLSLKQMVFHRTSSSNFLNTVTKYLNIGKTGAFSLHKKELTEFITQDKVQLVIFAPIKKASHHSSHLFKGIFIRSKEGLVYYLSTWLNIEGEKNRNHFNKIINESIKSIRQIRPDTFYSLQKHPVNFPNGQTLLFSCPKGFYPKEVISKYQPIAITRICDLSVFEAPVITINIVDSISFNKPQTKSSFYQKGKFISKPVSWYRFENNSENILLFSKIILRSSTGTEYFFLVVSAPNKKDIQELITIAEQTILIN
jgi:hypothetical protein